MSAKLNLTFPALTGDSSGSCWSLSLHHSPRCVLVSPVLRVGGTELSLPRPDVCDPFFSSVLTHCPDYRFSGPAFLRAHSLWEPVPQRRRRGCHQAWEESNWGWGVSTCYTGRLPKATRPHSLLLQVFIPGQVPTGWPSSRSPPDIPPHHYFWAGLPATLPAPTRPSSPPAVLSLACPVRGLLTLPQDQETFPVSLTLVQCLGRGTSVM